MTQIINHHFVLVDSAELLNFHYENTKLISLDDLKEVQHRDLELSPPNYKIVSSFWISDVDQ